MEKRVYFKNLNGLRFIAATMVIFHHIEQYKLWAKLPNLTGNTAIEALGHKAVSFFFVLSGFLITYLLLVENKQSGEINVRNFYIRRILRIWPLYYLIVLFCLFVVPVVFDLSLMGVDLYNGRFILISALLLLVLPNAVRIFYPTLVGGNQLWSIGVEEQFYLVWPLLIRQFISKIIPFLAAFIGLKLLLTVGLEIWMSFNHAALLEQFYRLWVLLQVEQMAIGAIGAWVLFTQKDQILKVIYHKATHIAALLMMASLFVLPIHHWWINYAEAVVFVVVIMNLSTNPAIAFNIENKLFNTLGNISYGIYMYHTLCITLSIYLLKAFGTEHSNMWLFNLLLYTLSVVLTIAISYASYEYFEKKFLGLKERFMVVKSGKNAVQADDPAAKTVSDPAPLCQPVVTTKTKSVL